MNRHPGGEAHTLHMLELAGLSPGSRVLDLGAGDGEALALLRSLGHEACGIDLAPRGDGVERGDLLHTGCADGSFDAVLSQCAFYVSGDVPGALREARRLLRPGGMLLLSDVFFAPPRPMLEAAGFRVLREEDLTEQWRDYYLEAIWRGDAPRCDFPRQKCVYRLLIGRKEGQDGSF